MKTSSPVLAFAVAALLGACAQAPAPPAVPAPVPPPVASSTPAHDMPMSSMPTTAAQWAHGAMRFENLGDFHRAVSTGSPEAQGYFDQGMRLLWAFNHDEATRSFAKAAELDPQCAICWWGVALTVGPNYNMMMMAESRAQVAWDALQEAQRHASQASPVEQALIAALGKRYPGAKALDPSNVGPVLVAYADAMRKVAAHFRADSDVQTLFAESMMNVNAWKLWTPEGKAAPGTQEIVTTLEAVLKRDARHPGANHYYIHAMEASPHPEKAVQAAERIRGMMPAAGHLEHMPAHIMQRVGRYEEAAEANRKGAVADRAYLATTTPPDYYGMYVAHNFQFLAYSTAMEGRRAETLDATQRLRAAITDDLLLAMPGLDWYVAEQYQALLRFGLWDQMIAMPAPNPKLTGLTGGYLFAKGVALAAKGQIDLAKTSLAQLESLAANTPADLPAGLNSAKDVLAVATLLLQASIAQAQGKEADNLALLRQAVAREDQLAYDEPSDWFFPVRHQLGARLLKAGKSHDAEAIYREDLQRNPKNGWSLFGLAQALKAQHRAAQAASVETQFRDAWKHADVTIAASAY